MLTTAENNEYFLKEMEKEVPTLGEDTLLYQMAMQAIQDTLDGKCTDVCTEYQKRYGTVKTKETSHTAKKLGI